MPQGNAPSTRAKGDTVDFWARHSISPNRESPENAGFGKALKEGGLTPAGKEVIDTYHKRGLGPAARRLAQEYIGKTLADNLGRARGTSFSGK